MAHSKEEPKKETLDQVAKKQWGNIHRTGVLAFIEGANWQAERMYSEEDVKLISFSAMDYKQDRIINYTEKLQWFEQFKK